MLWLPTAVAASYLTLYRLPPSLYHFFLPFPSVSCTYQINYLPLNLCLRVCFWGNSTWDSKPPFPPNPQGLRSLNINNFLCTLCAYPVLHQPCPHRPRPFTCLHRVPSPHPFFFPSGVSAGLSHQEAGGALGGWLLLVMASPPTLMSCGFSH